MLARRQFLAGLLASTVAPAIPFPSIIKPKQNLLTIYQITREAIRLFKNTNMFIANVDAQYEDLFINENLRIRLPIDYITA